MKNADMPAMPQSFAMNDEDCGTQLTHLHESDVDSNIGLTKREMFAMNFHAAILSRNGQICTKDLASKALEHADALLAELDK